MQGDLTPHHGEIMLQIAKGAHIGLAILLIVAAPAVAAAATELHPGPWPIRHWRFHQPRRSDITPQQNKKIDRLYLKIERENPTLIAPVFRPK